MTRTDNMIIGKGSIYSKSHKSIGWVLGWFGIDEERNQVKNAYVNPTSTGNYFQMGFSHIGESHIEWKQFSDGLFTYMRIPYQMEIVS